MIDRYQEILDECISRMLQGETIDDCLARYPEMAAELGPDLQAFLRTFNGFDREPSQRAFDRSRQRIAMELQRLERQDIEATAAESWWQRTLRSWSRAGYRQRVIGATAALLVVVFGGLGGTVAASNSALPGDTLYTAKRAVEELRLAFAFSEDAKAELQLAYAGRRAEEASRLLERGEYDRAAEAAARIGPHLDTATVLAAGASPEFGRSFAAELNMLSTSALSTLDAAVAAAPPERREAAAETAAVANTHYTEAAERIAGPTYVAGGPSTMEIWAVDPPPPGVDHVLVHVRDIQGYLAAGDRSRWENLIEGPRTFDLVRAAREPQLLGSATVEAGTYTRFRFTIDRVTVVIAGTAQVVTPDVTAVQVQRPFSLTEGGTTPVFLDFDGDRSVRVDPSGPVSFSPVVIARSSVPGIQGQATPGPSIAGTPAPTPTLTPTPTPISASGVLLLSAGDRITLSGNITVRITAETRIDGTLLPGVDLTVTGVLDADGTLVADHISVLAAERGSPSPTPAAPSPTPTPTTLPSPTPTPGLAVVNGLLEPDLTGVYLVDGQTVTISKTTRITGALEPYARVSVQGARGADGAIAATVIVVVAPPETVEVIGQILALGDGRITVAGEAVAVTAGTTVSGVLTLGSRVEVLGVRRSDGTVVAASIQVLPLLPGGTPEPTVTPTPVGTPPPPTPTPTPLPPPSPTVVPPLATVLPNTPTPLPDPTPTPTTEPQSFAVIGTVTSLLPGLIVIEGQQIVITEATTFVGGIPVVGSFVRVDGIVRADGTAEAQTITL